MASWRFLWALERVLEASWRRLGGVLEALEGVLEASWRLLKASWRRLGSHVETRSILDPRLPTKPQRELKFWSMETGAQGLAVICP